MFVPSDLPYKAKVYSPTEIRTPFTGDEVQTSDKKLKNRKSNNGLNTICSYYIKYADISLDRHFEDMFNEVAATGNYSEELKTGIITPIQKKSALIDHLSP